MVKYSRKRSKRIGRKKRYSKRRYSKKRYSKKRYSKKRSSKKRSSKRIQRGGKWTQHTDPKTRTNYYYNSETNESVRTISNMKEADEEVAAAKAAGEEYIPPVSRP